MKTTTTLSKPYPINVSPAIINTLEPCTFDITTLSYSYVRTLLLATIKERESLQKFRATLEADKKTIHSTLLDAIDNLLKFEYDLVAHLKTIDKVNATKRNK